MTDPAGAIVRGIEDLLLEPVSGHLILSAHDRPAVDRATDTDAATVPEGGLWRLDPAHLTDAGVVPVAPLAPAVDWPNGLRPHGIGLTVLADGRPVLGVVNRGWVRGPKVGGQGGGLAARSGDTRAAHGGRWEEATGVHLLSHNGDGAWQRLARWDQPELCSANDVAPIDHERAFVTLDRGGCDAATLTTEALGGGNGRLLRLEEGSAGGGGSVRTLASGLRFANGVLLDRARNRLWLAQTRGERLSGFALDQALSPFPGELAELVGWDLGLAPDNLSLTDQDHLLVGALPDLLGLALYRVGMGSLVDSAVLRVDPVTGTVETLLHDRSGHLFPGLTGAVQWQDWIIGGSVQEPGLLVCRLSP